jgi:hypothetical protein
MEQRDIFFWIVIIIIVVFALHTINTALHDNENFGGSLTSAGRTSTMRDRMRERNQELAIKCARMFTGDIRFINKCTTEDGSHLRYNNGINNTFAIWSQNQNDGVEWGSNVYLAMITGNTPNIICQVVFGRDPERRRMCESDNVSEGIRREAWHQYWQVRRERSPSWNLTKANIRLR